MKTFEIPEVEVKKFNVEDILTASGTGVVTEPTTTEAEPITTLVGNCL